MFNFPKIMDKSLKNFIVQKYSSQDSKQWNEFVNHSKNGTFLHNRNFMDYHADRFDDYSLIVLDNKKWVAVLPANISDNQVYSHQGLTYGGLLYDEKLKLESVIVVFQSILRFLNINKIEKLIIKTIPSIYHKKPAEELNYALFLANAKLVRRDSLSVIDLTKKNKVASGRIEGVKKGLKNSLTIKEENNFEQFWNEILIPNLQNKYQTKPVHSFDEIVLLKNLFPDNIRQFNVYNENRIVAGTTIFESEYVAHSQYISGNETKSENGSLDFLYYHLITNVFRNKVFFDFGTSNEQQGKKLNSGLIFWKESFGASTIAHDYYEVETISYGLLDNVLI